MLKSTKYYSLILAVAFIGCGEQRTAKLETQVLVDKQFEECILDKRLSIRETKDLENKLDSKLIQSDADKVTYKRVGKCDSIPFEVTYQFKKDSLTTAKYTWSNLPGRKKEIETRLTILIKLLEERTGETTRFIPDKHRIDVPMTTRIEFYDTYFWDRNKTKTYSARIDYHDSGRSGQSSMVLQINFKED